MKNCDPLRIYHQIANYCFTYDKKLLEGRNFVILPLEAQYILQDLFVDLSTTDVHG